jgi:hypothetical protein
MMSRIYIPSKFMQDETGIKVEVVSEGGQPRKILIHIPDGRIM